MHSNLSAERPSLRSQSPRNASTPPSHFSFKRQTTRSAQPAIFSLNSNRAAPRGFGKPFGRQDTNNPVQNQSSDSPANSATGSRNFQEVAAAQRPPSRFAFKAPPSSDDEGFVFDAPDDSSALGDPVPTHTASSNANAVARDSFSSTSHTQAREPLQSTPRFTLNRPSSQGFALTRSSRHYLNNETERSQGAEDHGYNSRDTGSVHYDPAGFRAFTPHSAHARSSTRSKTPAPTHTNIVEIKQEEDISSIMMRGATDLRNTKVEVEELRRQISLLQSQLNTTQRDKEECLQRIQAVKDAAKRSLESSSQCLDNLKATLDSLKSQSQESFGFVSQAKASLIDVEALRSTVSESLSTIQPFFNKNGQLPKAQETKELIAGLQIECNNSQQVSEILRERLQAVGAELIDAKARVTDLESMQIADREALRHSSTTLTGTTEQVNNLAQRLKEQQGRLYDVLTTAADAQAQLSAAAEEIAHLKEAVLAKNAELENLRNIQLETTKLQAIIDERNSTIASLSGLREQFEIALLEQGEQNAKISSLESTVKSKDEVISDMKSRIIQMDVQIQSDVQQLQKLRESSGASQGRETAQKQYLEQVLEGLKVSNAKVQSLEGILEETRSALSSRSEKLHQANSRCQVIEERFEDQSVTLKITKEANGDLQEHMIESEAAFAKDLEATAGKLNCEIAVLKEQKGSLEEKITELAANARELKKTAASTKVEYEMQLKHQEETHQIQSSHEMERVKHAEGELQSSRAAEQAMIVQVKILSEQLQDVRSQLQETQSCSSTTQAETNSQIAEMSLQVEQLKVDNAKLNERSKTIETRYRAGDLNAQEREFINTLVKTSQSVHEQELVAKGNELRRRDNTILELRSKINGLESTLSKHLKAQAKNQAVAGVENRSLIDPATWASSDRGSSPGLLTIRPAAEYERETSNLTSKTPAPPRRPPAKAVESSVQATPLPARTPAPRRPALAAKITVLTTLASTSRITAQSTNLSKSNKPTFSKLARNSSDDIEEFERPACQERSPVKLGKREVPPEVQSPAETPRYKRLRIATRARAASRTATKQSQDNNVSKAADGPPKKTRRRK